MNSMTPRQKRGLAIAKTSQILKENDKTWRVPSQTNKNSAYFVKSNGFGAQCNCPDYKKTNCKCKHIFAVEYIVTETTYSDGTLKQEVTKKTYSQNWSAYNKGQMGEKTKFMQLLGDLVSNVQAEDYKFGRPKPPLQDIIYSMIFKVYSGVSGRRFTCDMQVSKELDLISKEVPFTTLKDYFNKTEVTEILHNLISITAQPLKEVESHFSIDSSGFGTSIVQNWNKYKHSTQDRYKRWVKCHIISGANTNVIPAVKITSEFDHDSPQLKELLSKADKVFSIKEVSGDKAYISRENLEAIDGVGAIPYIPFKKNVSLKSTHKRGTVWKKALHFFLYNQDEFMAQYHKRSNCETSFHMIKKKFGENVKAKNWTAQVNEVLCKVVCHNIYVLIMEMENLGITAQLLNEKSMSCTESGSI